jgi:hypothetical protein
MVDKLHNGKLRGTKQVGTVAGIRETRNDFKSFVVKLNLRACLKDSWKGEN